MTPERDSLERIVEEMRGDQSVELIEVWSKEGQSIRGKEYVAREVVEKRQAWAARIEALIPSKAEREFMEAAEEYWHYKIIRKAWPERCSAKNGENLEGYTERAYRALLAERGK